jgi:hypothetical protein
MYTEKQSGKKRNKNQVTELQIQAGPTSKDS